MKKKLSLFGSVAVATGLFFLCLAVPAHATSTSVRITVHNPHYYKSSHSPTYSFLEYTAPNNTRVWAQADAAAGKVRAATFAGAGDTGGTAVGAVTDQFTLNGKPGTHTMLTAWFILEGNLMTFGTPQGVIPSYAYVVATLREGNNFSGPSYDDLGVLQQDWNCYNSGCHGGMMPYPVASWPLSIRFDATAGVPFSLYYDLSTGAYLNAVSDFGHTASLSFTLPAGTSISSTGGYTQSASASAVPEPSTLLLLGSGMAGVAVFGRKFRKG